MHAYISSFYGPKFEPILKERALYSINRFQVKKAEFNFNVVPGEYNIPLTRITEIERLHEDISAYPRHWFNFISFNKLHDRINQNMILTDIVYNLLLSK